MKKLIAIALGVIGSVIFPFQTHSEVVKFIDPDRFLMFESFDVQKIDPELMSFDATCFKFPVSLLNCEPYAQGFKLTFLVGNPYNANFYNVSSVLIYHKLDQDENVKKVIYICDVMRGGKWKKCEVLVSPCSIEDIRRATLCDFWFQGIGLNEDE